MSEGKTVVNGLGFSVNREKFMLMGPNGAGKSSLAHVLAGREGYEVTGGSVSF